MAEAALLVISLDEQGQDTFINIMERLHPSKHVIFRIYKLFSKSNTYQSGQRSTQSQTLLQNRGTEIQRQGKFSFIDWSVRFPIEVSFRNPVNCNSFCTLTSESILNANCPRSRYIFGMRKEKQSECAKTTFQNNRVQEDSLFHGVIFLELYLSCSDSWQSWSTSQSKSCDPKIENRVPKMIRYMYVHHYDR